MYVCKCGCVFFVYTYVKEKKYDITEQNVVVYFIKLQIFTLVDKNVDYYFGPSAPGPGTGGPYLYTPIHMYNQFVRW